MARARKLPFKITQEPLKVDGVMHGPYPDIPTSLLDHYANILNFAELSDEQVGEHKAVLSSEWQYDQHAEAQQAAVDAGRTTVEMAARLHNNVLPWAEGINVIPNPNRNDSSN